MNTSHTSFRAAVKAPSLCVVPAEADRGRLLRSGPQPASGRTPGDRGASSVRRPHRGHGSRGGVHLRRAHRGVCGHQDRTAQEGKTLCAGFTAAGKKRGLWAEHLQLNTWTGQPVLCSECTSYFRGTGYRCVRLQFP